MMGLPNCSQVTQQLSRECDQPHAASRGLGLRLHLLMCRACRHYQHYLRWLQHNLPRALMTTDHARLSSIQREQIEQALDQRAE